MDKSKRLKLIHMARDYELDEPEAVAILEREMKNSDPEVRAAAATAVCDYNHVPSLVVACMELARADADTGVRVRAIQSLGWILEDEVDAAGADVPEGEQEPEELDRATYQAIRDLLVLLARDEKVPEEIGAEAVEGLGWLGSRAEEKVILEEYYARRGPRCRAAALIAAGRAGARDWEARVLDHLREKTGPLLLAALKAAASLSLRKAAARVQELCSHSDPEVRNAAILAVPAVLPSGRANRILKSLRKHKDPDTRRMVRSASEILEEEAPFVDGEEGEEVVTEPPEDEVARSESVRRAILSDFVDSAAFRQAPVGWRPWLPRLVDNFFSFLIEHQGTDPEEFEPTDLQEFLLEYLPVNLDMPPDAAASAPGGLLVLVAFMVETRRFTELESFGEALESATPDYLTAVGLPACERTASLPGNGGWAEGARGPEKLAASGPVKAHARSVDHRKRGAGAGAGGRPGSAARGKCPCGSGKPYASCCGAREKR